tara:strand:+ start:320 stop:706 length:387 start_codon:yes stop_codon:yes gene_type:complete
MRRTALQKTKNLKPFKAPKVNNKMTSEYQRLGGRLPEEIEWEIRQLSLPKYRKPLNKYTLVRLNNGIRQNQCHEYTQHDTLIKWIVKQTTAYYRDILIWDDNMMDEYGAYLLSLWWNNKLTLNIWKLW